MRGGGDDRRRAWLGLASLALAGLGAHAMGLREPLWWLGAGAVAAAVVLARRALGDAVAVRLRAAGPAPLRRILGGRVAPDLAALVLVLGACSLLLGSAALGDPPIGKDHPVHLVKVQQTADMLARGAPWGYGQQWFGGGPINYLYPFGAQLFVLSFRALSFGALPLHHAYGLAIFGTFALLGLAAYRFGRETFSPSVGLLTAVLVLADDGAFRMGGWSFAVVWGVWPQTLSVALTLLATSCVPAMVESTRRRPVAGYGVALGLSLLTHPTAAIVALGLPVLVLLACALRPGVARPGLALRFAGGTLLAIAIAMPYFGPYVSTAGGYAAEFGDAGASVTDLGAGVWSLDVLAGAMPLATAFGLLAMLLGPFARDWRVASNALLVLGLWVVMASSTVQALHLPDLVHAFGAMQYQRMQLLSRPYFLAGAAWAFALVARQVLAHGREASMTSHPLAAPFGAFLAATLLVPLAAPAMHQLVARYLARDTERLSERGDADARAALARWAAALHHEEPYRFAILAKSHEHDLTDLALYLPAPVYKGGFTPATSYAYRPESGSAQALDQLSVRYVITRRPFATRDFARIETFGGIQVYARRGPVPAVFDVDGRGEVRLTRFEDEHVELVAPAGSEGVLRLHVGPFPRWRATRDGAPVVIRERELATPEHAGVMEVDLAPGTYRFTFARSTGDWASLWLGLLALPLGLFGLVWGERALGPLDRLAARLATRTRPARDRVRPALPWVGVAGLAAVVAALAWASATRPPMEWKGPAGTRIDRVLFDVTGRLPEAFVGVFGEDGFFPCPRFLDRFDCTDRSADPDDLYSHVAVRSASMEHPSNVSCLTGILPEEGHELRLRWDGVPMGEGLVGHVGFPRGSVGSGAATFVVEVDGVERFRERVDRGRRRRWFALPASGTRSLRVRIIPEGKAKRRFCVAAQTIEGALPGRP